MGFWVGIGGSWSPGIAESLVIPEQEILAQVWNRSSNTVQQKDRRQERKTQTRHTWGYRLPMADGDPHGMCCTGLCWGRPGGFPGLKSAYTKGHHCSVPPTQVPSMPLDSNTVSTNQMVIRVHCSLKTTLTTREN